MDKESKLTKVDQSIKDCIQYLKENSISDEEKIDIKDTTKKSTIEYDGPDGKFTVKYDKKTKQAIANVNFQHTGIFKSTVTEKDVSAQGNDPVYHPLWGLFHQAFNH